MIEVKLFGPPAVRRDGQPVTFDTRKAVALLAYLALADRPRSRDALADLLWSENDLEHARGALRRTLSTLRSAIGPAAVEATRDHIRVVTGPDMDIDVHRFRAAVAAEDFDAAAATVRGDFLEGFWIRDAPTFEDWQRAEAEVLRRELASVLGQLTAARDAVGDHPGALRHVRRWLALDQLHEPAHRALIRLSALTGDRAGALAHYRECVRTLSRELGVPPLRETTLLYEAIREGTLAPPDPPDEPPRSTEPPPVPLIGRGAELSSLLAAHSDSREHGRVAVIEGEAGIGKTRLAEEFLARAHRVGAVTLVGRAFEEEATLAYGPVIDALRGRLRDDADWVERIPARARREVARLLPELGPPEGDISPPGDSAGGAASFLAGVWETLVAATAGDAPGVLLIDDAQWADEASLRLLAFGLRRLSEQRLLVLLTWRTPHDHPLLRVVAEVSRAGYGGGCRLDRLDEAAVGDLLLAVHPGRSDPELSHRLHAETEGLPLLLVEYLNAIPADAQEAWSLPSGARDLLRGRLDPVSETGRQILAAAAVIGRSFEVETLRSTSGRGEDETVTAVEELTRLGLIREGNPDYDFTHDQLRAVVYGDTSLARRRLLHARAALAPSFPGTVARHLQLAGRDDEAAQAYVHAAEQARSVFAHAEAVEHLRSALALGHPEPSTLQATIGRLQTLQGDYSGALRSYETAAATAGEEQLSGLEQRLGQVHHRRGDWALARAHLRAALDAVPQHDHGARARITADLSLTAHADGDSELAAELAARARDLADQAGDQHALAQAHNLLGLLATSHGDTAEAVRQLTSSLGLAAVVDDPDARIAALNNLALAHRACGELHEALDLTREAIGQSTRLGDRHREAALHNNLADLLHAADEPAEAMEHLKRAVSLFAQIGTDDEPLPEVWKLVRW